MRLKTIMEVADAPFFKALPQIREVSGSDNSEITWLVYSFPRSASGAGYAISEPKVAFTLWDDVLTALREGEAPQQDEVLREIGARMASLRSYQT